MTTKDNIPDDSEFRITRLRAKNYRSIRNLDMKGIESVKAAVTPVAPTENTIGGTNHD